MQVDRVVRFPVLTYEVKEKEVLVTLNYSFRKGKLPQDWNSIYPTLLDEAKVLAEPRGSYIIRKIAFRDASGIHLKNTSFVLPGSDMKKLLINSSMVAIFAVTIGKSLEDNVASLVKSGRYTEGVILDAVGSVLVDSVADSINEIIKREAQMFGYKTTPRYSPGYGDLSIQTQPYFLKEVDGEWLGISLSDTNLMIPQKSVTALLGIF
ncbi:MAG: hypothetical protein J7L41_05275 [Synergistetes bacterium]|nr:hypothetical protein [Synergistota bacterium]